MLTSLCNETILNYYILNLIKIPIVSIKCCNKLYILKQQIIKKDGDPSILRLALIGDIPEIITLLLLYKHEFYPKFRLITKDS